MGGRIRQCAPIALVFGVVIGLVPSVAVAQSDEDDRWATDWQVFCYAPTLEQWLGPDGSGDPATYALYEATLEPYAEGASCDDEDPDSMTGQARESLRRISRWFEGQGFPPPSVPFVDGRFHAVFAPPDAGRVCFRGVCQDDKAFYAYMGSTTVEQNNESPNMVVVRTEQHGHAHELFHAVQHAFPSFQGGSVASWVTEGTAQAVGMNRSEASAHRDLTTRDFSRSLHRSDQPYETEAFWRAVSREYTLGETFDYLARLFEMDLNTDLLAAVDRTFREEFRVQKGLAEVYPQVVARHLFQDRFFSNLAVVELTFPDTVRRPRDRAVDIGSNAYRVNFQVPDGKEGRLVVRIPPEVDEEYLHLVADNHRWDEPSGGRPRNEYAAVFAPGRHSVLVVLANVPPSVAGLGAPRTRRAPIEFMLTPTALCGFTAAVSAGPGAGRHSGPAHLVGPGLTLSDASAGWRVRVAVPAFEPGVYETEMMVVVDMPHPEQPGVTVEGIANLPDQSAPATLTIDRAEGDFGGGLGGVGRGEGTLEGRVVGRAGWRFPGGREVWFDVSAEFTAVKYRVSPRSSYQACREGWGLESTGDLMRELEAGDG